MQPGQRIHASVDFCPKSYDPKAKMSPKGSVNAWADLVGGGDPYRFKDIFELDIFDDATVKGVVHKLNLGPDAEMGIWLHRLLVMTGSCEFFCY
jgi:hypothetical protein